MDSPGNFYTILRNLPPVPKSLPPGQQSDYPIFIDNRIARNGESSRQAQSAIQWTRPQTQSKNFYEAGVPLDANRTSRLWQNFIAEGPPPASPQPKRSPPASGDTGPIPRPPTARQPWSNSFNPDRSIWDRPPPELQLSNATRHAVSGNFESQIHVSRIGRNNRFANTLGTRANNHNEAIRSHNSILSFPDENPYGIDFTEEERRVLETVFYGSSNVANGSVATVNVPDQNCDAIVDDLDEMNELQLDFAESEIPPRHFSSFGETLDPRLDESASNVENQTIAADSSNIENQTSAREALKFEVARISNDGASQRFDANADNLSLMIDEYNRFQEVLKSEVAQISNNSGSHGFDARAYVLRSMVDEKNKKTKVASSPDSSNSQPLIPSPFTSPCTKCSTSTNKCKEHQEANDHVPQGEVPEQNQINPNPTPITKIIVPKSFNPLAEPWKPAPQHLSDPGLPHWRWRNAEAKQWLAYAMWWWSDDDVYASPTDAMATIKDFQGNGSTLYNKTLGSWIDWLGEEAGTYIYEEIQDKRWSPLKWTEEGGVSDLLRYTEQNYPAFRANAEENEAKRDIKGKGKEVIRDHIAMEAPPLQVQPSEAKRDIKGKGKEVIRDHVAMRPPPPHVDPSEQP